MSLVDKLKAMTPQQKLRYMEKTYEKNRSFFHRHHPEIGQILDNCSAKPYHVQADEEFLRILNEETGEECHPTGGLADFVEALGDWTHDGWIDLISEPIRVCAFPGKYAQYPSRFQKSMLACFTEMEPRFNSRHISLPQLNTEKRFSSSVLFAGVFHGLHVDSYLSRTQVCNAAFIEPDINRFVLSCAFLDYQTLGERFDGLVLYLGDEFPTAIVNDFLGKAEVTAPVWLRVLPGYESEKIALLVQQTALMWRVAHDVWMPPERSIWGMRRGMQNIREKKKLCVRSPDLSSASRIVVVGSGPSLSGDLPWLKDHQEQLVIFAAHSAVSALKKHGIKPDFQFSAEIHGWEPEHLKLLQLDEDIPIVTLYLDVPKKFSDFKDVFMLAEKVAPNPVKFKFALSNTRPTTGNLALSFACNCYPEELYLLGLDFGFRDEERIHVAESFIYTNKAFQAQNAGRSQLPVQANFSDTDTVLTQPYFNQARQMAERAIESVAGKVKVFNCSDGALVRGAEPLRAEQIALRAYDKQADIDLIRSSFRPLRAGEDWEPFPMAGEQLLSLYKKGLLNELKMKKFNWFKFAKIVDSIDHMVLKRLPRKSVVEGDMRLEPYMEVVRELLIMWYRFLCFGNNEHEWQQVYEVGYQELAALIEDMHWDDL